MSDNAGSELGGVIVMLAVIGVVFLGLKACDHKPSPQEAAQTELSSRLDEVSDKVDKMQRDLDEVRDKLHIY